jgi:hypothetical protein
LPSIQQVSVNGGIARISHTAFASWVSGGNSIAACH